MRDLKEPSTGARTDAPGSHPSTRSVTATSIANGLTVVFVSRRLGHAGPNVTLEV